MTSDRLDPSLSGFGDLPAEGFEGDGVGFGSAAHAFVECIECVQLVGREVEVEDVEVLGGARRLGRLGGSRNARAAGASAA
jgi:hypothetical protein